MPTKYYIYGVPGVGKSTLAADFARRHNFICLGLDDLRPKAQALASQEEEPFIYEYTTEAWKRFGELSEDTAVKGFLAVRQAFQKYIWSELSLHGDGYIAEATYIDPKSILEDDSKVTLLITSDERLHYSHFFLHRPRSDEEDSQFKAARWIQDYLINEAASLGVTVLDNNVPDISSAEL